MADRQLVVCDGSGPENQADTHEAGPTYYCLSDEVIAPIRKKYAMQIIALLGPEEQLRYGDLQDRLTAPDATLTQRLAELGDAGLIDRHRYAEIPPRVEYSLTPTGRELYESLQPLLEWAAQQDNT